MSDSFLSIVIVFAELGVVSLLLITFLLVRFVLSSKNETVLSKELVEYVKTMISSHTTLFNDLFNGKTKESSENKKVESILKIEKSIFKQLIRVSVTKNTSSLKTSIKDVDELMKAFVDLLAEDFEVLTDDEKEKRTVILRKENHDLREKVKELEISLKVSGDSLDNMLVEMSAMYEGSKEDSEQRLKNEKHKLKKSLKSEEEKTKNFADDTEGEPAEIPAGNEGEIPVLLETAEDLEHDIEKKSS